MKKLIIVTIVFFFAFNQCIDAQKKVIVLNAQHDARYKNNGPRFSGHMDNGNHKNRGKGNTKWHNKKVQPIVVAPRHVVLRDKRDIRVRTRRHDDR
jgi:hypothetical protein